MKPQSTNPYRIKRLLAVAGFFAMSVGAHAADWFWDSNGTTDGAGTTPTGTWGTDNFWSTNSLGTASTTAWTTGNTAVFAAGTDATGTYAIAVSGTQSTAGLKFQEGDVTLSGGTGITLTAAAVDVASGATGTISTAIGGSAGLTKTGVGTLTLSGTNGYTGVTNVSVGKLIIASGGSVVSSNVTSNVNGSLEISGTFSTTAASGQMTTAGTTSSIDIKSGGTFTAGGGFGTIIGQNAVTTSSLNVSGTYNQTAGGFILGNQNASANGTLNVNTGGLVTFASTMTTSSASGALNAAGVVLGRNDATGTINLNGGTLETAKNIIRGTGTGNFNFNGGTLKVLTTGTSLDVTTTTVNTGGATVDTNGLNFSITDAMVAGTGSGGLTKNGAGTLTLNGVNTYTGDTTVNGGTLTLADNAQLAFVIGANGVNNKITGTGTVTLAGDFNLNLTGANATTGNQWTLVDVGALTETFASTFSLVGFTENNNVHIKVVPGSPTVIWAFTESTGKLTVANGTDYDGWLAGFTFGPGADTTPTGDPDGDGLINRQEHAFGLNPTNGSSASPVTVMLDKTAGTFSYTRRKPSLTGMTFKIETSATLTGWTEDATATQSVTGTAGDIETVQVTLSGPIPLTASKFFVRAVATQP